jgi:hypothetical protein
MTSKARSTILVFMLFLVGWDTAGGLDVPLPRVRFEAAWTKGKQSKTGEVVESYHLGSRYLPTGTIDAYLSTPYARVLYRASKKGRTSRQTDLDALWAKVKDEETVYLLVTSAGSPSPHLMEPRKGEPAIERARIRKPAEPGEADVPLSRWKVRGSPDRDYVHSLGMNWGWLFEFDPALFAGDEDIEVIVETTRHRAVIPVERGKLLALPENEPNPGTEPR